MARAGEDYPDEEARTWLRERAGEGHMGDDLIERLREFTTDPTGTPALVDAVPRGIFARAADEIERLRDALDDAITLLPPERVGLLKMSTQRLWDSLCDEAAND